MAKAKPKTKPRVRAVEPVDDLQDLDQISKAILRELLMALRATLEREEMTAAQIVSGIAAVTRCPATIAILRKKADDRSYNGSTVRKYAQAFQANAARGRAAPPRPAPDDWDDVDVDEPDYAADLEPGSA